MSDKVEASIRNLNSLLFNNNLSIPSYQRPYKWQAKNVNQLIDDIILFNDKSAYRLGTVVVYNNSQENKELDIEEEGQDVSLEIVDGQQRIITLSLIIYELLNTFNGTQVIGKKAQDLSIKNFDVSNPISLNNIVQNKQIIKSRIHEFDTESIVFLLNKCELVYIELTEISEAFQFFDSQNSRGKDLEPHDLLKAFHLRKMSTNSEEERFHAVDKWEKVSDKLHDIFSNYLFSVRQWNKGRAGMYFTKNKVKVFKGISLIEEINFHYVKPYKINHFYTEKYNNELDRRIDNQYLNYPFQLDQVIIDGQRFFEFVHYYSKLVQPIKNLLSLDKNEQRKSIAELLDFENQNTVIIIDALRSYKGQHREGDKYVKNLFYCCLLYYIDKFGPYRLDEALRKFFIWSYKLRLEKQAIQKVTVDNQAKHYNGMFRLIREAIHPNEILHLPNPDIKYVGEGKMVRNTDEVVMVFKKMNLI